MADLIPEKDLQNLLQQLGKVNGDKDRIRLCNAAAEGWKFSCAQIKRIVEKVLYGNAVVYVAVALHAKCTDPENYDKVVIGALQFEEDKQSVRKGLQEKK